MKKLRIDDCVTDNCCEILNRMLERVIPPFSLQALRSLSEPPEQYKDAPPDVREKRLPDLRACYDQLREAFPVGRFSFIVFDAGNNALNLDTCIVEKAFNRPQHTLQRDLICILAETQARGFQFVVESDALRVLAPKGALTPKLKAVIAQHKAKIIALIEHGIDGDDPEEVLF